MTMSSNRKRTIGSSRIDDNQYVDGSVARISRFLFGSNPSEVKSPFTLRSKAESGNTSIASEIASFSGGLKISKEKLRQDAINKASSQLLDRLFHFLSMLPSPDEHGDDDFEELYGDDESVSTNAYSHYSTHYKNQHRNSTKSRGLTLPAAAIGWLAHRLCPLENSFQSSNNDSSSIASSPLNIDNTTNEDIGMKKSFSNSSLATSSLDRDLEDKLVLLKWLLRKVTHLKVTTATWPPDPPASPKTKLRATFSTGNSSPQNNVDMNLTANEIMHINRNENTSYYEDDSSIASNDFSTNSFLIQNANNNSPSRSGSNTKINALWHQIRSFPRVDMQMFPNVDVLILDCVPPEWMQNMDRVQEKLTLLSLEKGAIFHLNNFLFPLNNINSIGYNNSTEISSRNADDLGIGPNEEKETSNGKYSDVRLKPDIYSKLTHLKLSHCALGEMSGLRGSKLRRSKEKNQITKNRNKLASQENIVEFQFSSILHDDSQRIDQQKQYPPPLSRIPNLQTLSLSNNQIINPSTALSGLSSLPNLSSIDLSFNYITSMKNSYLKLGNIRTLILSNNKIEAVSNGLDRLFSLETLSLDRNRIEYSQNVAGLANLPFLTRLDLWGNPFIDEDEEGYRVNVLALFMQKNGKDDLPILDNLLVSEEELKSLEALNFGDAVRVDDVNEKSKVDYLIEGKDQISLESSDISESKSEQSMHDSVDDTDTTSSTSSFPQSGSSDQMVASNSSDKALNRKKVTRLKKSIYVPVENVEPAQVQRRKSEPSSFCTIGQSYKDLNDTDSALILDVIDSLTISNPYLIQKRITSPNESKSSPNEEKTSEDSDETLQRSENNESKIGGFDKSRFAFLTQNIDELDDDDDSQGDYNLLSMSYTMKILNKDTNDELSDEYVPLFDDDIDFDVDLDTDKEADAGSDNGVDEPEVTKDEKITEDIITKTDIPGDSTSSVEKSIESGESSSVTSGGSKAMESNSVLATNEAVSEDNEKESTGISRDASLLEKLNKLLISPVAGEQKNSQKNIHQEDEDDDDDDENSSVSTLGSLPSFSNKNYLKPISHETISSFKEKKTSENISLIQELLEDDDDYWNDESSDNDLFVDAPLEPTSMFEGIENLNIDQKSIVAQYDFDFDLAELYATYDAPQKNADKPVSGNLDLYFRTYIFPLTIYDENDEERNNLEKLLSLAIPRIQLCIADRDEIIDRTLSFRTMATPTLLENIKGGERFVRFWYDKVLPCGVAAKTRIEPVFSKLRGFHGDSLMSNGRQMTFSESQPIIICLSDMAVYFVTVKYKKKRQAFPSDNNSSLPTIEETSEVTFLTRLTKNGEERTYPSPLPVTSSFKDCNWPHALARHSLSSLKRISIGFGFQRLTLHFKVSDDDGFSSVNFSYVIHTWNKKRTVSMIQALQTNNKGKNQIIIDNDDSLFLESLGKSMEPAIVGSVLHYQILCQKWRRGGRNSVRRACVVTDTLICLLDEDYVGDGSNTTAGFAEEAFVVGNVELSCVDSAPLEHILDVEASPQDPNELTIVIKAPSFLQKNHRWRLICNDREGAEQLLQYIRNGME